MKLPRNLPGNEYDPKKHRRRSIRLRHYDYSRAGTYFITVCTNGRELLFGEVIDDEVKLNELGRIAAEEWLKSAQVRTEIELDTWVVMPNHIHGIVMITDDRRKSDRSVAPSGPRPRSLGALMAGFKSAATKRINTMRGTPGASVWQRNYYEHVIRNESALNRIRQYVADNPARWSEDPENPAVGATGRSPLRPKTPWTTPSTPTPRPDRPHATPRCCPLVNETLCCVSQKV